MLGRKVLPEEEEQHAELVQAAKIEALAARKKFDVYEPGKNGNVSKQIPETRRVLTWETADGREGVEVQLVATGYQDSDFREGLVDTSGRVSLFR